MQGSPTGLRILLLEGLTMSFMILMRTRRSGSLRGKEKETVPLKTRRVLSERYLHCEFPLKWEQGAGLKEWSCSDTAMGSYLGGG